MCMGSCTAPIGEFFTPTTVYHRVAAWQQLPARGSLTRVGLARYAVLLRHDDIAPVDQLSLRLPAQLAASARHTFARSACSGLSRHVGDESDAYPPAFLSAHAHSSVCCGKRATSGR